MAKKIYDVVPPVGSALKSLAGKEAKKGKLPKEARIGKKGLYRQPVLPVRQKKRFPWAEIFVGGVIIIFLFGIYFYNKLPWVDIQISPKLDLINIQEKITADKSVDKVDFSKKIIPLQILEETKEFSQEFLATGNASNDGKATGTIKVYNKIRPSAPLTLKAGTHFLSDSGKYFVTLEKITIPPMRGKSPGSVDAKVQAEEAGPDYNIGPSNFSVPMLSGTSYYYVVFAGSTEAMAGGYMGKVKKVTKDDLESAKDVLTKKLLQDSESSLRSKIPADEVLLEGAILSNVIDSSSDSKPDAIADKFNESAKVEVLALVFKKSDLEKFAKGDILSQLPEGKDLLEDSLELKPDADFIDIKGGMEKINLQISAKSYDAMDLNDLVGLSRRKSAGEVKEIIHSKYGDKVYDIKINFWPFWVKKVPADKNRIKINLNLK